MREGIERDRELAERLAEVAGSEGVGRAEALMWAADRMVQIGGVEDALAALSAAVDLFEAAGVTAPVAACEHNMAVILRGLGRTEEALEHHERAVAFFREQFDSEEAARCTLHVGDLLHDLGRHEEALAAYAAVRDEQLDSEPARAGAAGIRRGRVLVELARHEEAVVELTAARPLVIGCVSCVAKCVGSLADALAGLGRLDDALEAAQEAAALWDACGADDEQAAADLRVAELLARLGRVERALQDLHDLRHTYRDDGDTVGVARCDRAAAIAFEARGDREDAERLRRTSAAVLAAAGVAA